MSKPEEGTPRVLQVLLEINIESVEDTDANEVEDRTPFYESAQEEIVERIQHELGGLQIEVAHPGDEYGYTLTLDVSDARVICAECSAVVGAPSECSTTTHPMERPKVHPAEKFLDNARAAVALAVSENEGTLQALASFLRDDEERQYMVEDLRQILAALAGWRRAGVAALNAARDPDLEQLRQDEASERFMHGEG